MQFQISKATRNQIKLRAALIAPSGGGKTFSALRLAKGMGEKTGLIDTENHRALYYATEFDFQHIPFNPPFSPENYIAAIDFAIANGCKTIILDSASHEWMGLGGILNIKDSMPPSQFQNGFAKWAVLTPRHDAFIDKIQRSDAHLIVCLRGKDEYVLEQNDKGKQVPRKVGVGMQMRDGLEYECTVALLIDQETHKFSVTKDNTHLFENRYDILTEKDGEALKMWAETGEMPPPPPPKAGGHPNATGEPTSTISVEQALDFTFALGERDIPQQEFLQKTLEFYASAHKKEYKDVTELPASCYDPIMRSIKNKPLCEAKLQRDEKQKEVSNVGSK
jgi:hypothetical protein